MAERKGVLAGSGSTTFKTVWTSFGVLLGLGLAVIAVLIRTLERGWPDALDSFGHDPMLWLVAASPVGLGLLAYLAGREVDRASAVADSLRHQVEVRAARHAHASKAFANAAAERARLLTQLEEGIAYFDADGRLLPERSAAFERLVPHAARCETIDQLLERCGAETETVAVARLLIWGGEAAFEANQHAMLLPSHGWTATKSTGGRLYRRFSISSAVGPMATADPRTKS